MVGEISDSDQPIIAQVAQPFKVCVLHHVLFAQSRESVFPVDVQRDQGFCNYNIIVLYVVLIRSEFLKEIY